MSGSFPYFALAFFLSIGFVALAIWRMSSLLIALHGRGRVAAAGPLGHLLAVSRSEAPPSRTALRWGALVIPMFPFVFALFNNGPASLILLVATAGVAAVSAAGIAVDRSLQQ